MKGFLNLMRVKQWIKNLFILIPGFFAGILFQPEGIVPLLLGFLSFSLGASAIYIINDYRDIAEDRNHPEKRNRPLASGSVKNSHALMLCVLLAASSLTISYLITINFFYLIVLYLVINLGYSFGLKNVSILDIALLSSGFLFRTIAGGFILDVPISKWLLIMVYLLALFMALAKRLDDYIVNETDGAISRKTVKSYNLTFIHSGITMISAIIIVSYIMYTISDEVILRMHTEYLYFTSIFVIMGILRYLQITLVENKSGSPTKILLTDKFIFFTLLGWVVSFFIIIYL